jgi:uncharacterized protein
MPTSRRRTLPPAAGLGFKPEHFDAIAATRPRLGFFEIHAENYMGAGGPPHAQLAALRADYALSIHGVGLSIGAPWPLDRAHLDRLAALCARYEPESFSEHLAWSTHDGAYFNDLLPLPYDEETLVTVCEHVDAVQEALALRMLLENPSTYLAFSRNSYAEADFLREVVARTGCGLLLDVNNVFVSAVNQDTSPRAYLDAFPLPHVGEIHLGGHAETVLPGGAPLLIDAHCSPVVEPVWTLYEMVIARTGALPTLIEWDNDVPAFPVLFGEADRAAALLAAAMARKTASARPAMEHAHVLTG